MIELSARGTISWYDEFYCRKVWYKCLLRNENSKNGNIPKQKIAILQLTIVEMRFSVTMSAIFLTVSNKLSRPTHCWQRIVTTFQSDQLGEYERRGKK